MDSGVYHMVYQQNEDFQELRSGGTFEQSVDNFAMRSVHPEDRSIVLELVSRYIGDFFDRGLMKRTRKYRVLHRASGEYVWYEATALRIDLDNPKNHRSLIIWKLIDPPAEQGASSEPQIVGAPMTQSLLVCVQQCLNDQWFTMTYSNEGFVSLFGYNAMKLNERFQNRFVELIHPADRLARSAPVSGTALRRRSAGAGISRDDQKRADRVGSG